MMMIINIVIKSNFNVYIYYSLGHSLGTEEEGDDEVVRLEEGDGNAVLVRETDTKGLHTRE